METGNIVNILIKLEHSLAKLYAFYAKLFPGDKKFFVQLAREEIAHERLLRNYKNILPLEFQRIDRKALADIEEAIRDNIAKYKKSPPSIDMALNFSYLIENSVGEAHYQALLDSSNSSERVKVFQILNFGDKDHAKRIKEYLVDRGRY